MTHVYFDHNATTPLDERVLAAMLPYLREQYGNASSRHEFGTLARKAVNQAREQVHYRPLVINYQHCLWGHSPNPANGLFAQAATILGGWPTRFSVRQ